MKMTDADVIWTPVQEGGENAGQVRVERHASGWVRTRGDRWMMAANAWDFCWNEKERANMKKPEMQKLSMFILFNTLVVRDGIDPQMAHSAFLRIKEYREMISPDMKGAEK